VLSQAVKLTQLKPYTQRAEISVDAVAANLHVVDGLAPDALRELAGTVRCRTGDSQCCANAGSDARCEVRA
jgi:hypothetical protein